MEDDVHYMTIKINGKPARDVWCISVLQAARQSKFKTYRFRKRRYAFAELSLTGL